MPNKPQNKKAKPTKYDAQYTEIVKQLQTSYVLPEGSSLAQPSPLKVLPTVVTYGAYEEPILG